MEVMLTLAVAGILLILLAISEFSLSQWIRPAATRRLVHAIGALTAATFPLYLHLRDLLLLSIFFIFVLGWSWWRGWLHSIHGVERGSAGALVFPGGLFIAAWMTWSHPQAFAFASLVLGLADSAASLAGSRSRYFHWRVPGGSKSAVGSMAFFSVTLMLSIAFSTIVGSPGIPRMVLAALSLTLVEGTLGYGLDNLALPIAAGVLGETLLGL